MNTNCKYLMLQYSFEVLKFHRVEFVADVKNTRSCKAILRFGAKKEGILRKHMMYKDGRYRDSALFSVIDEEWPDTKQYIQSLLKNSPVTDTRNNLLPGYFSKVKLVNIFLVKVAAFNFGHVVNCNKRFWINFKND
ncbi:MAG: GNAT family N-acetyltransferase [Kurthia sp.]|nr:GNAT family N-acetyltransferase [Candidatus Kurthia equi]